MDTLCRCKLLNKLQVVWTTLEYYLIVRSSLPDRFSNRCRLYVDIGTAVSLHRHFNIHHLMWRIFFNMSLSLSVCLCVCVCLRNDFVWLQVLTWTWYFNSMPNTESKILLDHAIEICSMCGWNKCPYIHTLGTKWNGVNTVTLWALYCIKYYIKSNL
jgi:hypothetical protein